jgi:hypothetical protein
MRPSLPVRSLLVILSVLVVATTASAAVSSLPVGSIGSRELRNGGVASIDIRNGTIGTYDLADGAVESIDIADATIRSIDISEGAIESGHIADGTITASDLAPGTIIAPDLAPGSVTSNKLAIGSVTANTLATGAVTSIKLAVGSVTSAAIADGTITSGDLADGSVTSDKLATGSIGPAQLAQAPYLKLDTLQSELTVVGGSVQYLEFSTERSDQLDMHDPSEGGYHRTIAPIAGIYRLDVRARWVPNPNCRLELAAATFQHGPLTGESYLPDPSDFSAARLTDEIELEAGEGVVIMASEYPVNSAGPSCAVGSRVRTDSSMSLRWVAPLPT